MPMSEFSLPALSAPVLRTPEHCFATVRDFPYAPHYLELSGGGTPLRVAYIDEGPRDAPVVLLMHGEPTWSYLYRTMIPPLLAAGLRVVAPDLVGFGRSDKPSAQRDYSYAHHVAWMNLWLAQAQLERVTLFCQDWGSLIGLRMACAQPQRFDRIALANGGLPTGTTPVPRAFKLWRAFATYSPWFPIGRIVRSGCAQGLNDEAVAAYNAPFPTAAHRRGARAFPRLVPMAPNDPERAANEAAWVQLRAWDKPFITLFSSRDPITRGGDRLFQAQVPGAQGQAHQTIRGAGHFLQEDRGPELAQALIAFVHAKAAP
jgi:haloalkane dehalogenase